MGAATATAMELSHDDLPGGKGWWKRERKKVWMETFPGSGSPTNDVSQIATDTVDQETLHL